MGTAKIHRHELMLPEPMAVLFRDHDDLVDQHALDVRAEVGITLSCRKRSIIASSASPRSKRFRVAMT